MKIGNDATALAKAREFFDDTMYAMVDYRLSFEAPIGPTGFPGFQSLKNVVARLDPVQRALFRLFRLGEAVGADAVEAAIPSEVLDALGRVGLLERQGEEWRTPNLLLVPVEGVLVFVSIPPSYATATAPCRAWFDLSSYVFAKALPGELTSQRVLDVCSGTGVQSLLCARRGATSVTGLELDSDAVEIAVCNAAFNRLSTSVEFRQSDKLAALKSSERFDLILCNGPYAPVTDGSEAVSSLGAIGNRLLMTIINDLPGRLAAGGRGVVALWRSVGTRSRNEQRSIVESRLAAAGLGCRAFVDRAQDGIEGMLRILEAEVKQRYGKESGAAAARALLAQVGDAVDGTYNQLIVFERGSDVRIFGLESPASAKGV
ncbi:methyltransferase [Bradyrhizobium sp. 188]|uniref:methyltransferase n=1 Tax=Bradyrhizobium sp. 188 TaxID=2782656 RepID=UPI001FF96008|nr:methyltransferase [Bradyrhizobium sp. 188]MCK1502137.1 methyltransferase [Bradyrhizobium sp. 188]